MPFPGIQLLFETLVQCTRMMCKCEKSEIRSKDCKPGQPDFREPVRNSCEKICCAAKSPGGHAAVLDSRWRAP
jgi:hypothetical protein